MNFYCSTCERNGCNQREILILSHFGPFIAIFLKVFPTEFFRNGQGDSWGTGEGPQDSGYADASQVRKPQQERDGLRK